MGGLDAGQFDFLLWEVREKLNKGRNKDHCRKKTPEPSSGFRKGWSQGMGVVSVLNLTPEQRHFFLEMGEEKRRTCEDTDTCTCWGKRADVGSLKAFINHLTSLFLKKSEVSEVRRGCPDDLQVSSGNSTTVDSPMSMAENRTHTI